MSRTRSADPRKTHALVVGIEKYGTDWKLRGAAGDACRFVEWLCERGVPPENILLFLSPLDENRLRHDCPTRVYESAISDNIYRALIDRLGRVKDGQLFCLFWGGHGVSQVDDTRYLFCADANQGNGVTLNVNKLLGALRTELFAAFPVQIGFVDACANYKELEPDLPPLTDRPFPAREPVVRREQFFIFSTQRGRRAENRDDQETGLFSSVLLEELAQTSSDLWPPDMDLLRANIQETFDRLREARKARQTPVVEVWDWEGNRYSRTATRWKRPFYVVPIRRTPLFEGRKKLLSRLRASFLSSDAHRSVQAIVQAISGTGGFGKTQTALQYIHRYHEEYDAIFLIRAETQSELESDYVRIARRLDPENITDNSLVAREAVWRWLDGHDNWLLVFDNADYPDLIKSDILRDHKGHILLTSRRQDLDELEVVKPIKLDVMSPKEAEKFLFRRTNCDDKNPRERKAAAELAEELGYLPLALEQAGAYIKKHSNIQDYLASYRLRPLEVYTRCFRTWATPRPRPRGRGEGSASPIENTGPIGGLFAGFY